MTLLAVYCDSNKELSMATRKSRSRTRRAGWRPTQRRSNPSRRTRSATNGGNPWSRQEIAFMRKYYRNNETSWVARQLGRTVYSVRYKASDLSIRKSRPSVWKGQKGTTSNMPRRSTSRKSWNAKSRWSPRQARSRHITRRRKSRR